MRNRCSSTLVALLAAATLCVRDAASQDSDTVEGKPRTDAAQADGADCRQTLALARRTLEFVERSRPCPELAARLTELERRADALSGGEERGSLCHAVRQLRRQIIFSHPLLDFDRLLVNKCPPPAYSHQSRQYLGRYSRPGPGLVVLDNWKDSPRETPLLAGRLPAGTVMHPDLSFDARRVVFAFCDHTPADPNLRQFFLWEVGIDGQGLRQLTGKAADRLAGAEGRQTALIEDFDPCYLPDGGIAFVSTRTQTHIRCQYGFRYFANFLLYRADASGEHIRPLSFAEAPEWEPSVLDDGRIVYSRWDYTNRHSYHFQSPWVSRPDGTGTANVYGNLTRNPINTAEPRAGARLAQDRLHGDGPPRLHGRVDRAGGSAPGPRRAGAVGADHAGDRVPRDGRLARGRLRQSVSAERGLVPGRLHAGPARQGRPSAGRERLRHLPGRHARRTRADLPRSGHVVLLADSGPAASPSARAPAGTAKERAGRRARACSTWRTSIARPNRLPPAASRACGS